jgi:hypothetical protein
MIIPGIPDGLENTLFMIGFWVLIIITAFRIVYYFGVERGKSETSDGENEF